MVYGSVPTAQNSDGTTWNGQDYDTEWCDEMYDQGSDKIWYTSDGQSWYPKDQASWNDASFLVDEITNRNHAHDVYLAGIGRWQKIDCTKHATYVILDSGCTRSMGSRARVTAFVDACRSSGFKGKFQFVPCCTQFSFANSQASKCWERLVIHFPTNPPCRTEVDILEEGSVPILISLQQMRNFQPCGDGA